MVVGPDPLGGAQLEGLWVNRLHFNGDSPQADSDPFPPYKLGRSINPIFITFFEWSACISLCSSVTNCEDEPLENKLPSLDCVFP